MISVICESYFGTVLDFLVIKAFEDIEHPCKNTNIVVGNSN
jgi:hypothetical protein